METAKKEYNFISALAIKSKILTVKVVLVPDWFITGSKPVIGVIVIRTAPMRTHHHYVIISVFGITQHGGC